MAVLLNGSCARRRQRQEYTSASSAPRSAKPLLSVKKYTALAITYFEVYRDRAAPPIASKDNQFI